MTPDDWKVMYEAQERDVKTLRDRVEELEAEVKSLREVVDTYEREDR